MANVNDFTKWSPTKKYREYIASPEWRKKREHAIVRAGFVCQNCKVSKRELEVHHLTYRNLGNESPHELIVLCHSCHKMADEKRRRDVYRRLITQYGAAEYDKKKFEWDAERRREGRE